MSERYLIINADDFGISDSANKAITKLFTEKRITSSTVMAPGPKSKQALDISLKNDFPIGVHLTINSDWQEKRWHSLSPKPKVSSLLDDEGLLYDTKLLAKVAKSSHVTIELEAQIQFILDSGCNIDHADNHCGTLYGTNKRLFFINAFKLCKKYNLPFRFPKRTNFLKDQFNDKVPSYIYAAHGLITSIASIMGVPLIDDLITNPYSMKEISNYENLRDYYLKKVANCKEGITEMFLHPAFHDEELSNKYPEWEKREMELKFLLGDELFNLINDEDIKLVSWKEAPFK